MQPGPHNQRQSVPRHKQRLSDVVHRHNFLRVGGRAAQRALRLGHGPADDAGPAKDVAAGRGGGRAPRREAQRAPRRARTRGRHLLSRGQAALLHRVQRRGPPGRILRRKASFVSTSGKRTWTRKKRAPAAQRGGLRRRRAPAPARRLCAPTARRKQPLAQGAACRGCDSAAAARAGGPRRRGARPPGGMPANNTRRTSKTAPRGRERAAPAAPALQPNAIRECSILVHGDANAQRASMCGMALRSNVRQRAAASAAVATAAAAALRTPARAPLAARCSSAAAVRGVPPSVAPSALTGWRSARRLCGAAKRKSAVALQLRSARRTALAPASMAPRTAAQSAARVAAATAAAARRPPPARRSMRARESLGAEARWRGGRVRRTACRSLYSSPSVGVPLPVVRA